jgi:histidinol-phosphate aminotransferase
MEQNLTRRNWLKSTLGISAGVAVIPSWLNELQAAPMSEAERSFFTAGKIPNVKVRLNSNENPYGPSEKARKAVIQILSEANRYQFAQASEFRKTLAAKEGVEESWIHLGSGSGELLCQTGISYGLEGGELLSAYPTFPLLMTYAEKMRARWKKIDLNENLEHDYKAIASGISADTKLVIICNPNNPTGTLVDPSIVASFCEEVSKKVPVFSDEAYLEFLEPAQQKSMIDLVKKGSNVIVARTFSKIYGLAGLRMGYIVAHPDTIKRIGKYGDEISASQTAIAAAKASLGDEDFMKMTRQKNAEARKVLTDYLDRAKISYGKSHINLLFFPAPKDGRTMLTRLEEKGFLIRIWDYQQKEWCRVSIGTADEMKAFVKTFDELIS